MDALELGRLGGSLEHLRRGHALAQDLAGRRLVAEPVEVAAADLERAHAQRLGDPADLDLGGELVWGAPNPRNAPLGGVFVRVARARIRTFGQRYGPPAWSAPRDRTTGVSVQYAPPSMTTSISWAVIVPSTLTPVRWVTIAGWRFVVAERSSWRS